MTQITSASVNLGALLVILGVLLLSSLMGVSGVNPIQSLSLVVAIFGVWLAIVSVFMPRPSASYAATRSMFLGWGGVLTGLGVLWLAAYYGFQIFAVVFATLLIIAGVGAVGYSITRAQAKKTASPVA